MPDSHGTAGPLRPRGDHRGEHAPARGLPAPGELSVIAYHDQAAQLFNPALTAVSPPRASAGEAAAELLIHRLPDPVRPAQRVLVSPRLILRASTAPASACAGEPRRQTGCKIVQEFNRTSPQPVDLNHGNALSRRPR
ncbi:MAG: substrate-binding domain-containing protein [Propionibacteriaceae bacterium]|nr:substrate-binding domain-containing protein [Propionibacteriaceae bacterium]